MRKFFVNENQIEGNIIKIEGQDVNHIRNVLRLEIDEKILICDMDNSKNYISKINLIEKEQVICEILEETSSEAESNIEITIFQGLPKADKMELIIQKGTELGVKEFVPISFSRSIVKLQGKDEIKKIERWQKIAEMASKQSGRDLVPKINGIKTVQNLCKIIDEYDIVLLTYELESENSLKNELRKLNINNEKIKIGVIIGPEGGIEEQEVVKLKEAGAKVVTLGKRILRTETVALMVTSIIMYELET